MSHDIKLEKRAQRQIDARKIREQLMYIVKRALASNRAKQGWCYRGKYDFQVTPTSDGYLYTTTLNFKREGRKVSDDVIEKQFNTIKDIVRTAGNTPNWIITTIEGVIVKAEDSGVKQFAEIHIAKPRAEYFGHIYDRDAQIKIVQSAIEAATSSDFRNRFHCVLYGPPACGKTDILASFKRMLGPDAVMQFDATSMTSAGAIKSLTDSAKIPPVLIVEEIEKTDENSLKWLLGVLDHRAEIRKTNFHMNLRREVKLLCLATVNDIVKFKSAMSGALASRFAHKIYCPRPNRAILEKILAREIEKISGNSAWIKPTLDYCLDKEGIDDPRRIVSICLSGRNALLTNEYQQALDSVKGPDNV